MDRQLFVQGSIILAVTVGSWMVLVEPVVTDIRELEEEIVAAQGETASLQSVHQSAIARLPQVRERLAEIRRDGSILQFVPFALRAWHAGASSWRGRERCNDFSIGIELEGADSVAYEDAQYASLAALIAALIDAYPTLRTDAIAGHSDIAPGRKTDPGPAFDWLRLYDGLSRELSKEEPDS